MLYKKIKPKDSLPHQFKAVPVIEEWNFQHAHGIGYVNEEGEWRNSLNEGDEYDVDPIFWLKETEEISPDVQVASITLLLLAEFADGPGEVEKCNRVAKAIVKHITS